MMKKPLSPRKITGITIFFCSFFLPGIALAQPSDFAGVVGILLVLLNFAIPVIIGLTIMFILWNASQAILQSDNPQKRTDGRSAIIWGVIVLFVMVSVWGIINVLQNTFGL